MQHSDARVSNPSQRARTRAHARAHSFASASSQTTRVASLVHSHPIRSNPIQSNVSSSSSSRPRGTPPRGEMGVGGKGADEVEGGGRVPALGAARERILEGVVPLAVRALSSQHAAVPPLAVRCLAQLSTMRLAAFDSSTGALARRIMALMRECPRANAQLAQDCLKLLNNLLKRHAAFTPTDAQFRFIISFAFGDLEVRLFASSLRPSGPSLCFRFSTSPLRRRRGHRRMMIMNTYLYHRPDLKIRERHVSCTTLTRAHPRPRRPSDGTPRSSPLPAER